jgi:hypothetical protein
MIRTYAVIATANRPEVCLQAIESLRPQVDDIYVIDNGNGKRIEVKDLADCFVVFLDWKKPLNLSKFWNIGLNLVASIAISNRLINFREMDTQWNVAIINDDAIVPLGWVEAVGTRMRKNGAAAACSGSPTENSFIHTEPGPVSLHTRMQGWAFMLAGEKGLRFDEDLVWWFQDDDMDWRSRQAGGMLMIPGYPVVNRFPNGQMTPDLQAQTALDRKTFEAKWGMSPW